MTDTFRLTPPETPDRSGIGGHHSPSAETHTWLTPPYIIEALGPFDLDPCAAPEPRPWPTATTHWTHDDNSLNRRWPFGERVWLNPPYGGPTIVGPWMRRMADHDHGTALIFARTETDVFHECVWTKALAILFLKGRLFFHHPNGKVAENNSGGPSCLIAYGGEDAKKLRYCDLPGRFILL